MKTNDALKEELESMGYEGSVVFENPDFAPAAVGVTDDGNVVYDFDRMVEFLCGTEDMTMDEAADFISYNTIRSIPYFPAPKPIVIYPLSEV